MQEKHIDISLDKRLLKALDDLIKQGVYRNRDEAIRIAISEKLYRLQQTESVPKKDLDNGLGDWSDDYLEDKFGGSSV